MVADIRALVADLPTYGYHRVHALLRRQAEKTGREAPNPKRVYRVMKVHGLLLQRDGEHREERRHNGRVAIDLRNTRLPEIEVSSTARKHSRVTSSTMWRIRNRRPVAI